MVSVPGIDRNTYSEKVGRGVLIRKVTCPNPSCLDSKLRGHGWYQRFVDGVLTEIRRLRCFLCGVTHALLPEDMCAYRDVTLTGLEAALETTGPTAGARVAGQTGTGAIRRVRSWMRAMRAVWVSHLLALLPACEGELLDWVRATVGEAPGALVRLRHWLWSKYRYFFGGPTGLFRHGRPMERVR